ncbi:MAG: protein kinase [Desulfomonile tiedjei]|nr:protein kinase [Desulfomonile tiedjei]
MSEQRIALKIIPTPATHDLAESDLLRISRITKIPAEKIRDRIARGKGITIITAVHPKVQELLNLIKSMGFSVITEPVPAATVSGGAAAPRTQPPAPLASQSGSSKARVEENEWRVGDIIENLYEVRDIKHGGMGAVYVVRHRRWNVMMAVKSLLKRLQDNEEDRSLFLKEAETWIDVGFHPNIAACYYVRNINEHLRIFVEYADGGPLNYWLAYHRPVGWDLLIDLMVQFCDGLEHAHSKGLVHRDVKPGNCMMTKSGTLKVTDFGLTKRRSASSADLAGITVPEYENVAVERESITAAGMGTPGYMAPEMWIPHADVGPAADIYAFGVMFFELCCGRKPFVIQPGERRDKLAYAHVKKQPPSPCSLRKDLPGPIEELILKCLNKSPEDRYTSFGDVREELTAIFESLFKRRFTREKPDEVRLFSDALNNRAVSLMDLNHHEEAEAALEKALRSDPHHPEAVYNRGLLEWLRSGKPDWDLVKLLEEVVKAPEYQGRAAHLLGRCLLTLGDASRAQKACETALSSEESSEDRLKPYSIALIGCGKDRDAIAHMETYLKEYPNDDEAIGWLVAALARSDRSKEAEEWLGRLSVGSELAALGLHEITEAFVFTGLEEQHVLKGHTGWVTFACPLPKSDLFLTASRDRTLRVWDPVTGEEKGRTALVGQPPGDLWISPDERLVLLASGQAGAPSQMLDLESGRYVGKPIGHEGLVTAAGFSRDGGFVVTVEQKGAVRLWDAVHLRAAGSFKVPIHTAAAVVSSDPADLDILVAGMDRMVKRIRLATGQVETFDPGHRDAITGLKADPCGTRALTSGRDRQVIVWNVRSGTIVTTFQVHQEPVTAMAINPVRDLAASYDPRGGLKVWDVKTGMVFRSFSTGDAETHAISFSRDGTQLGAGGKEMVFRVWDVRGRHVVPGLALAKILPVTKQMRSDRKFKALMERAHRAVKKGAFAKAYRLLRETQTLAGYERSDQALDLIHRMKDRGTRTGIHGGWKRKTFETQSGVMDVMFSPSAINFLTAQADHTVKMWSTKTGDCVKSLRGHTNVVAAVKFSGNGREAVSGGDDRTVRTWDLHTGRNLATFKGHLETVSCVAFSRDGAHVLSGSWDQTLRLWRLADGLLLKTLKGHNDKITSLEFVSGSEYAVSAGFEGVIRMWDLAAGRLVRELRGHEGRIMGLRVSPQGDVLMSVAMDGTARMWDLKKGLCLGTATVGGEGVRAAAFSPDQRFFVTGGTDTVLKLWNTDTFECKREFQGHSREITGVDFSSNGRYFISSSLDGSVMLWELDWEWDFQGKNTDDTTRPVQPLNGSQ